jgi:predicted nuclease with TOPRIM domain
VHDRLQARLQELKKEFATGQARLQELEKQQLYLRETMLRISGAIQVLEELLADGHSGEQKSTRSAEAQHVSVQTSPVNVMHTAFQATNLEGNDHQPSKDSVAGDALGEKE